MREAIYSCDRLHKNIELPSEQAIPYGKSTHKDTESFWAIAYLLSQISIDAFTDLNRFFV